MYVRDLTEQELNDNYMASYAKGASEGVQDSFSLYPRGYVEDSIPAGEESAAEYAQKRYFANLKH